MHRIRHAVMALGLLASAPARAEFKLSFNHPAHMDGPTSTDAGTAGAAASPDGAAVQPSPPRFGVARGFGNDIPLEFAVRQIVPATTRVSYGPGVDIQAIVNWKGGRPWPAVLLAAVLPLGMKLRATSRSVAIFRR